MPRTIAIGDIHGCLQTFKKLVLETINLQDDDTLVLLGDYIDRGPDSRGVINFIFALQQSGYKVITLKGNHEELLQNSEYGFMAFHDFVRNGGDKTLESFDVDFLHEMQPAYQEFFNKLPLYYEQGNYLFVHAGFNFDKDDLFEDEEAMLWIRGFEPNQPKLGNKIVIHGHTPMPLNDILNQTGNVINIDAGCVFKSKNNMNYGHLVALHVEDMQYYSVPNCEDESY
jgi:serine/threonine protein phosphatase 1